MTKEELIKLSRENLRKSKQGSLCECYDEAFIKGYELSKKRIAELEQKISVLLSCKNCPENKGGFICVKEYENKCLAQKIQYIKELQEEIKNLKKTYRKQRNKRIDDLQKENAELKADNVEWEKASDKWKSVYEITNNQLTKAKEIIKELMSFSVQLCDCRHTVDFEKTREEAEQFLKGVEK